MGIISKETKAKLTGKETWIANVEGHEIKVINDAHATMYIDGVEADKEKGLISLGCFLSANLPDSDKTVFAHIISGAFDIHCVITVGVQCKTTHGVTNKDGSFVQIEDKSDDN